MMGMGEAFHPRFAGQLGIKRLYHYEKFDADYLSTTLRDQKVHCSTPQI